MTHQCQRTRQAGNMFIIKIILFVAVAFALGIYGALIDHRAEASAGTALQASAAADLGTTSPTVQ